MFSKYAFALGLGLALVGCKESGSPANEHGGAAPAKAEGAAAHEHAAAAPAKENAGHEHGHGEVDPGNAVAGLTLDNGKKWQTDETLRSGMTKIRDAIQADMKPIHDDSLGSAGYEKLAGAVEAEVGEIVAKCKLPKAADEQLHLVLAQVSAGAAEMKKGDARMGGAVKVMNALEAYAKFFEHPDWKPMQH